MRPPSVPYTFISPKGTEVDLRLLNNGINSIECYIIIVFVSYASILTYLATSLLGKYTIQDYVILLLHNTQLKLTSYYCYIILNTNLYHIIAA